MSPEILDLFEALKGSLGRVAAKGRPRNQHDPVSAAPVIDIEDANLAAVVIDHVANAILPLTRDGACASKPPLA
jgi:hypothetical protein